MLRFARNDVQCSYFRTSPNREVPYRAPPRDGERGDDDDDNDGSNSDGANDGAAPARATRPAVKRQRTKAAGPGSLRARPVRSLTEEREKQPVAALARAKLAPAVAEWAKALGLARSKKLAGAKPARLRHRPARTPSDRSLAPRRAEET